MGGHLHASAHARIPHRGPALRLPVRPVRRREFGLPAVVGAADAVRRFPAGSRLSLDGTTGDIRLGEAP
ncbi:PEP-utilizing enzyme [Streptomyces sp. NPDC002920]